VIAPIWPGWAPLASADDRHTVAAAAAIQAGKIVPCPAPFPRPGRHRGAIQQAQVAR